MAGKIRNAGIPSRTTYDAVFSLPGLELDGDSYPRRLRKTVALLTIMSLVFGASRSGTLPIASGKYRHPAVRDSDQREDGSLHRVSDARSDSANSEEVRIRCTPLPITAWRERRFSFVRISSRLTPNGRRSCSRRRSREKVAS